MAVTLETIARRVGVSKSTVSLVLRDHALGQQFRPEVRERIKQVARELDYRPNFFATQLSTGKSKVLMLCLSHMVDPLVSRIAEAFERRASQRGYRVLINLFHDAEDPMAFHQDLLGRQGVSAVAILGRDTEKLTDEAILVLARQGVSIVCVSRELRSPGIGCVVCDNHAGGALSARHIYGLGLTDLWSLTNQRGALRLFDQRVEERKRERKRVGSRMP